MKKSTEKKMNGWAMIRYSTSIIFAMNAIDLVHGDKKHRARKAGVKAKKKDAKDKKKRNLSTDRHNPRAFSVANVGRTKKNQQRNLDRAQKKELVPLINRAEELPPPIVIVVAGPRGVGKSTMIRSLVKLYTGQNMTDIKGPVTVVAGKKQRFTFFECPIDVYSMTDLAKVADLVMLMIDSSYGFEMETFEFLNLLQLHGFPKVVGVLTHMDKFKMNKTLQKTKKRLKNRFWTEIYKGAKLFDFTGVVNGKYLKHEVKRISMYMARLKFRPLVWRNTHPYVLVDRVEDITSAAEIQDNPNCDREISLFGYLRGTHLKPSMRVHLIGAGDFEVTAVSALEDPCPMPSQNDRTSLKSSKDSFLYAPFSNVGRVKIDKDGMYIEIKDIHYTKSDMIDIADRSGMVTSGGDLGNTPAGLLRSMQDVAMGVDERMHGAELSLFKGDHAVKSNELVESSDEEGGDYGSESEEEDDEDEDNEEEGASDEEEGELEFEGDYNDSDEENEDEEDEDEEEEEEEEEEDSEQSDSEDESPRPTKGASEVRWKQNMADRAEKSFEKRVTHAAGAMSMMERVYGKGWAYGGITDEFKSDDRGDVDSDDSDSDDDLFKLKNASQQKEYDALNSNDSSRPQYSHWAPIDSMHRGLASAMGGVGKGGSTAMYGERSGLWRAFASRGGQRQAKDEDEEEDPKVAVDLRNTYTMLKNRFVTGDWSKANMKASGGGAEGGLDYMDSDEEVYGDFEDLQTGEKFGPRPAGEDSDEDDSDSDDDDDDMEGGSDGNESDVERMNRDIDEQLRDINAAKKAESRMRKDKEGGDAGEEEGKPGAVRIRYLAVKLHISRWRVCGVVWCGAGRGGRRRGLCGEVTPGTAGAY
jgi:ribosome biogenesis protein BMS1